MASFFELYFDTKWSDGLTCQVCLSRYKIFAEFKRHIYSKEHQKEMDQVFLTERDSTTGRLPRIIIIERDIKLSMQQPLLGLQLLTVCFSRALSKVLYLCHVCREKVLDEQIVEHLDSGDHRNNYRSSHPRTEPFPSEWTPKRKMWEHSDVGETVPLQMLNLPHRLLDTYQHLSYSQVMESLDVYHKLPKLLGDAVPKKIKLEKSQEDPQEKCPPPPDASEKSYKVHCQNCNMDLDTLEQYFLHVQYDKHKTRTKRIARPSHQKSSSHPQDLQGNGEEEAQALRHPSASQRRGGPPLAPCVVGRTLVQDVFRQLDERPLRHVPGASLMVLCYSSEAKCQAVVTCFVCHDAFPKWFLWKHLGSHKHLLQTLMHLNPWRLPFGWKKVPARKFLQSMVTLEEKERGWSRVALKVMDLPYSVMSGIDPPSYEKVMDVLESHHVVLKRNIPPCQTYSRRQENQTYPLLGRNFLVSHACLLSSREPECESLLCLMCGRRLSTHEGYAHVFSWEHVFTFLERFHPGSWTPQTDARALLQLATKAAGIHTVSHIQKIKLDRPIKEPCNYDRVKLILGSAKKRGGKGFTIPLILRQAPLVAQKSATPEKGRPSELKDAPLKNGNAGLATAAKETEGGMGKRKSGHVPVAVKEEGAQKMASVDAGEEERCPKSSGDDTLCQETLAVNGQSPEQKRTTATLKEEEVSIQVDQNAPRCSLVRSTSVHGSHSAGGTASATARSADRRAGRVTTAPADVPVAQMSPGAPVVARPPPPPPPASTSQRASKSSRVTTSGTKPHTTSCESTAPPSSDRGLPETTKCTAPSAKTTPTAKSSDATTLSGGSATAAAARTALPSRGNTVSPSPSTLPVGHGAPTTQTTVLPVTGHWNSSSPRPMALVCGAATFRRPSDAVTAANSGPGASVAVSAEAPAPARQKLDASARREKVGVERRRPSARHATAKPSNGKMKRRTLSKIGLSFIVAVKSDDRKQSYCTLCGIRLERSSHPTESIHLYNYMKRRFPELNEERLAAVQVEDFIFSMTKVEKHVGLRNFQTIRVSADEYNELSDLPEAQALQKLKTHFMVSSQTSMTSRPVWPPSSPADASETEAHDGARSTAESPPGGSPDPGRRKIDDWDLFPEEKRAFSVTPLDSKPQTNEGEEAEMNVQTLDELRVGATEEKVAGLGEPRPWPSPSSGPQQAVGATDSEDVEDPGAPAKGGLSPLEPTGADVRGEFSPRSPGPEGPEGPEGPPASNANALHPLARYPNQSDSSLPHVAMDEEGLNASQVPVLWAGTRSNLSSFLWVRYHSKKPVIGLSSVYECRGTLKDSFYLCESCGQKFTLPQICPHVVSDEHRLKYMLGAYPHLLDSFWYDKELVQEMKVDILNDLMDKVAAQEASKNSDAKVVFLYQDWYQAVWKASFAEALDVLRRYTRRLAGASRQTANPTVERRQDGSADPCFPASPAPMTTTTTTPPFRVKEERCELPEKLTAAVAPFPIKTEPVSWEWPLHETPAPVRPEPSPLPATPESERANANPAGPERERTLCQRIGSEGKPHPTPSESRRGQSAAPSFEERRPGSTTSPSEDLYKRDCPDRKERPSVQMTWAERGGPERALLEEASTPKISRIKDEAALSGVGPPDAGKVPSARNVKAESVLSPSSVAGVAAPKASTPLKDRLDPSRWKPFASPAPETEMAAAFRVKAGSVLSEPHAPASGVARLAETEASVAVKEEPAGRQRMPAGVRVVERALAAAPTISLDDGPGPHPKKRAAIERLDAPVGICAKEAPTGAFLPVKRRRLSSERTSPPTTLLPGHLAHGDASVTEKRNPALKKGPPEASSGSASAKSVNATRTGRWDSKTRKKSLPAEGAPPRESSSVASDESTAATVPRDGPDLHETGAEPSVAQSSSPKQMEVLQSTQTGYNRVSVKDPGATAECRRHADAAESVEDVTAQCHLDGDHRPTRAQPSNSGAHVCCERAPDGDNGAPAGNQKGDEVCALQLYFPQPAGHLTVPFSGGYPHVMGWVNQPFPQPLPQPLPPQQQYYYAFPWIQNAVTVSNNSTYLYNVPLPAALYPTAVPGGGGGGGGGVSDAGASGGGQVNDSVSQPSNPFVLAQYSQKN